MQCAFLLDDSDVHAIQDDFISRNDFRRRLFGRPLSEWTVDFYSASAQIPMQSAVIVVVGVCPTFGNTVPKRRWSKRSKLRSSRLH